jgi:hypothetical protein
MNLPLLILKCENLSVNHVKDPTAPILTLKILTESHQELKLILQCRR